MTTDPDLSRLAELRELLDKADQSPRPWSHEYDPQPGCHDDERIADANDAGVARGYCSGDAALIVAAINALPWLLDAAEQAEKQQWDLLEETSKRDEAVAEAERLRARVAELEGALKPFAKAGAVWPEGTREGDVFTLFLPPQQGDEFLPLPLTVRRGDYLLAAEVLKSGAR